MRLQQQNHLRGERQRRRRDQNRQNPPRLGHKREEFPSESNVGQDAPYDSIRFYNTDFNDSDTENTVNTVLLKPENTESPVPTPNYIDFFSYAMWQQAQAELNKDDSLAPAPAPSITPFPTFEASYANVVPAVVPNVSSQQPANVSSITEASETASASAYGNSTENSTERSSLPSLSPLTTVPTAEPILNVTANSTTPNSTSTPVTETFSSSLEAFNDKDISSAEVMNLVSEFFNISIEEIQEDYCKETNAPTATPVQSEFQNNDSQLIIAGLQLYVPFYVVTFVLFSVLRKHCQRYYNIRSWVPELYSELACQSYDGYFEWVYKVHHITDDELFEHCGMDALCFARVLKLGRKLSLCGCVQAIYLLPLYATAEQPEDAEFIITDPLTKVTTAHLPAGSPVFLATVLASYINYIYAMYLFLKEFQWFTEYRYKYLMQRTPRNYAVYVSGIPESVRTSNQLREYFEEATSKEIVVDAQIAYDTPKLDGMVARREAIVNTIDHIRAWERINEMKMSRFRVHQEGITLGMPNARSLSAFEKELDTLNNAISTQIEKILQQTKLRKFRRQSLMGAAEFFNPAKRRLRKGKAETESNNTPTTPLALKLSRPRNLARNKQGESFATHDSFETFSDEGNGVLDELSNIKSLKDWGKQFNRSTRTPDHSMRNSRGARTPDHSMRQIDEEKSITSEFTTEEVSFHEEKVEEEEPSESHNGDIDKSVNRKKLHDKLNSKMSRSFNTSFNTISTENSEMDIPRGSTRANAHWRRMSNVIKVGALTRNTVQIGKEVTNVVTNHVGTGVSDAVSIVEGLGTTVLDTAQTVVNVNIGILAEEGKPKDAGFVVFRDLHSAQAALQMVHHHTPHVMDVSESPDPDDIFWRNVGLRPNQRQMGQTLSAMATAALCVFWSLITSSLVSLTSVETLTNAWPRLQETLDSHDLLEEALGQLGPLFIVASRDLLVPLILAYFATWEGHVSIPRLEASLFVKIALFLFFQYFIVIGISGSVVREIGTILSNPAGLVDILANALPAQSSIFINLILIDCAVVQAAELLRVNPLGQALIRRRVGRNLTYKERKAPLLFIHSLEDPPKFFASRRLASQTLFFTIFFVYSTIAPIVNFFLFICFLIMESGYRYNFTHNVNPKPDSGGKYWAGFIKISMVCILTAQITLTGLLSLKKSIYATPFMIPMMIGTVYFIVYLYKRHFRIANYLPTHRCLQVVRKNLQLVKDGKLDPNFAVGKYLQPSLKTKRLYPEELGEEHTNSSMKVNNDKNNEKTDEDDSDKLKTNSSFDLGFSVSNLGYG